VSQYDYIMVRLNCGLLPSRDKVGFSVLMPLNVFSLPDPSSLTMALRFTEPQTEMSTIKLFWGKV
jgi:hypothetical protein